MIGWFEVSVKDMNRAIIFYEAVFQIEISMHDMDGVIMGWFPENSNSHGITGSLVMHETHIPSEMGGALLYFTCTDVAEELSRVEAAGGKVLKAKTLIGNNHGYMGLFIDSEGNRIALHCGM